MWATRPSARCPVRLHVRLSRVPQFDLTMRERDEAAVFGRVPVSGSSGFGGASGGIGSVGLGPPRARKARSPDPIVLARATRVVSVVVVEAIKVING